MEDTNMADYTFKGYENFILENKINSILATKLDVNKFMTIDQSLQGVPGMKKLVHKYTAAGQIDKLARGEGNSHFIDAEFAEAEYEVGRYQGQFKYYDDDQMTDPTLIDTKAKGLAESMVNSWISEAIAEFDTTTNTFEAENFDIADFADAIAEYANVFEGQEGLYMLCSMDLVPTLRKSLGDYLKYTEGYIKTGAIGTILGVPVYTTKALEKTIFLADKEAVTAFIKKDTFVEQDRDIDKKENFVVASKYAVIALTDERRCIKITPKEEEPEPGPGEGGAGGEGNN